MPDIGFGEIVTIVVIALLVFGPDRLPKMAADAGRMLRQVRQMAANARADLVDAAGIENDAELSQTMRDLRDLDPRRGLAGLAAAEPTRSRTGSRGQAEGTASARPGAAAGRATPTAAAAAAASEKGARAPGNGDQSDLAGAPGSAVAPTATSTPASIGAAPTAPPVIHPVLAVDPDWT